MHVAGPNGAARALRRARVAPARRVADIEQILVHGVHGPGLVSVVVV